MGFGIGGLEFVVPNFFLMPVAMMYGAPVSIWKMLTHNWLLVLLGNMVTGVFVFGVLPWAFYSKRYYPKSSHYEDREVELTKSYV